MGGNGDWKALIGIGVIVIIFILVDVLGFFFVCSLCSTLLPGDLFPACENDFPASPPAIIVNSSHNYKSHVPVKNITVAGDFPGWSDTGYHNVKITGSCGNISVWSWGGVWLDADFRGEGDNLSIDWSDLYLTDDSFSRNPDYDYMDLPYNASCNLNINNHIGSVIVRDLSGPVLRVATNRGMMRVENCSFSRMDCSATTSINASFSSDNVSFRSTSGDITLKALDGKGDIVAVTDKGNIIVKVPEGSGFAIKAHTGSGKIVCNVPLKLETDRVNEIAGTTNAPQERPFMLDFMTQRGDIFIDYGE